MKHSVLIAVLASVVSPAVALDWNNVPMATGTNVVSLRGWLVPDPAGDSLYYSPWNGTDYTVYKLGAAAARNYGVTVGSDWTSIASPAMLTNATSDDDGSAFNVNAGKLYGVTKVNGGGRQLVRLDLTTDTWQAGTKPATGANINYAGIVYQDAGTTKFVGRWSGSRNFDYGSITDEATFTYTEAAKGNSPGFWGHDATIGGGYIYEYEQGITNGPNQLRRGSLTGPPQDQLVTAWVDAQGPVNNNQNRHTNASIEYIPGGINGAGSDELWVMPGAFAGDTNSSDIYRYLASDGSFIATEPLPFTLTNFGQGFDMAYMDGWLYVMQGRTTNVLWSTQLPEPTTLGLLALGLLGLQRRRSL